MDSMAYGNYASQQQPPPFQQQPQGGGPASGGYAAHGAGLATTPQAKSYGAAPQDQRALLGGAPDDELDPNGEDDNPFQVV
mmetsp:Transcript_18291/g.38356  ORF Transcript_18291/g.38356 Transcript_18291/m.38356 type:complete len:81 (+) Transcript_18291:2-244(+)